MAHFPFSQQNSPFFTSAHAVRLFTRFPLLEQFPFFGNCTPETPQWRSEMTEQETIAIHSRCKYLEQLVHDFGTPAVFAVAPCLRSLSRYHGVSPDGMIAAAEHCPLISSFDLTAICAHEDEEEDAKMQNEAEKKARQVQVQQAYSTFISRLSTLFISEDPIPLVFTLVKDYQVSKHRQKEYSQMKEERKRVVICHPCCLFVCVFFVQHYDRLELDTAGDESVLNNFIAGWKKPFVPTLSPCLHSFSVCLIDHDEFLSLFPSDVLWSQLTSLQCIAPEGMWSFSDADTALIATRCPCLTSLSLAAADVTVSEKTLRSLGQTLESFDICAPPYHTEQDLLDFLHLLPRCLPHLSALHLQFLFRSHELAAATVSSISSIARLLTRITELRLSCCSAFLLEGFLDGLSLRSPPSIAASLTTLIVSCPLTQRSCDILCSGCFELRKFSFCAYSQDEAKVLIPADSDFVTRFANAIVSERQKGTSRLLLHYLGIPNNLSHLSMDPIHRALRIY